MVQGFISGFLAQAYSYNVTLYSKYSLHIINKTMLSVSYLLATMYHICQNKKLLNICNFLALSKFMASLFIYLYFNMELVFCNWYFCVFTIGIGMRNWCVTGIFMLPGGMHLSERTSRNAPTAGLR